MCEFSEVFTRGLGLTEDCETVNLVQRFPRVGSPD